MSFQCPHCNAVLSVSIDKPTEPPPPEIRLDMAYCAGYWLIHPKLLLSQRKTKRLVQIRKTIYAVLKGRGYSLNDIAATMNRHHSTVLMGIRSASPKLVENTLEALCQNRSISP